MLDVINIVDKLASFGYIRTVKVSGDWYQCYCPFHSGGHEKKPSFGILIKDQMRAGVLYKAGFGHCFACNFAGDLVTLVTKILESHSIDKTGFDWLSENIPGFSEDQEFDYLIPQSMMEQITNKYTLEYIKTLTGVEKEQFITEEELASYRYTVPYMYERKLTDELIEKYDIGVDMNFIPPGRVKKVPCITFPVRDENGRTLFICRRSISGKMYNYPTGVVKPVYGLDMIPKGCKSLIICESCINALTAVRYGYAAVALLGTGNSYQISQLKKLGVTEFVLAMDGDEAGRRASKKLKNALKSVGIVWVINMPEGKDVNDLDFETFTQLYKERE